MQCNITFYKVLILIRFALFFISLTCSSCFSADYSSKELENFAQTLVFKEYNSQFELQKSEKLELKVAPIDKRISYPYCSIGLTGEIVSNKIKSNTSVKISCLDKQPWNTYVRVKVNVLLQVAVASSSLSKGQTLNETNITTVYMDKTRIRNGGYTMQKSLYGVRLKRNLSADKVIKSRDICFVCKGDKVTISAIKAGLAITASGIALGDANIGGTVQVRNSRTQRLVVGTVSGLKKIEVSF